MLLRAAQTRWIHGGTDGRTAAAGRVRRGCAHARGDPSAGGHSRRDPMMPCREESYRCEGFRFFRRCAGWPVDRDRERPVHAIHLEVAEPAAVSLLPAGTHSERSGVRADELVLELPPALLEKSLGERRGALELQRQEDIQDPRIQHLMYALLEDLREGCPAGSQYALSLVTALCVHLARRYTVRRAQPSSPVMPRTRLNRVLAFI